MPFTFLLRPTLPFVVTFRPFDQLYIHDSLCDAPPASYAQSDQTSGLLQSFHSSAVGHISDICVIHPDYTVIHPVQESMEGTELDRIKMIILFKQYRRQLKSQTLN